MNCGDNARPTKGALASIALGSVLVCTVACSGMRVFLKGVAIPLRVPQAMIVTRESSREDLNVLAYQRAFEAMGLAPRSIAPTEIQSLLSAGGQPVIALPARCAATLDAVQTAGLVVLVEQGAIIISEGASLLTDRFGFRPGIPIEVAALKNSDFLEVSIRWEHPARLTPPQPPADAVILARDAATSVPIVSLKRYGRGGILVLGGELDNEKGEGYTRFPFLPQALHRAGVTLPFRSERLSALFDWGYRRKDDLGALARRWRGAGIKAIHAGAWAFYDGDPAQNKYLETLIAACHQNGILVFAWLELPHVSEKFWDEHPEWREKTAFGEDAQLDWRYLMNLNDPDCFDAIRQGIRGMLSRFNWDGVNSAEVYFDSPSGPSSPEHFTPLNALVRSDVKARMQVDPVEFFRPGSAHFWRKDKRRWAEFVDYRVSLERDLNERILRELSDMKNASGEPLGLAVTYVDDLYDPNMREAVGADVRGMMPLLERYDFTLILEDPGTVWHLGPRRYAELASGYSKLTSRTSQLGIDINIVDRDKAAYPTRKQTGMEFLQLFSNAARNFETVMVYSEQTIYDWDLEFVANAMAGDVAASVVGDELRLSSKRPLTLRTGADSAEFRVDDRIWPCVASGDVLLPAGEHRVGAFAGGKKPLPRLINLNGDLEEAAYDGSSSLEFSYRARPRGAAIFNRIPREFLVDGAPYKCPPAEWVLLPGGAHRVRASF